MTTRKETKIEDTPIVWIWDTIVQAAIWDDGYGNKYLKVKYPKGYGRSHFYSMANDVDETWHQQYPEWSYKLHRQNRYNEVI